ncbi:uncharacterized protein LOC110031889 isoform X2 [Phalaenopsis equestris]|uniref:uncharacterized protein LOC110031889 isoform X2 n=1 Tax=Phalaenopsis equestris TaxID=78828 RepID=UPI0009E55F19|nr:uncharacterized protein LOC110031889 isoform X2 [Phalaenopsis equestris]
MSGSEKWVGSSRGLPPEASEVEEMLRAAEDELLTGLRVGSHTISSSSLDHDLARRFDALKAPRLRPPMAIQPIRTPQPSAPQSKSLETKDQIYGDPMNDDLMARFAALKSLASKPEPMVDPISNREDITDDEQSEDLEDGDMVSKKEVDKVIMWAMDAARLDPSVNNDEDNDLDEESDHEDVDVKELEAEVEEKKNSDKGKGKHVM